jgi:hypothetical protein
MDNQINTLLRSYHDNFLQYRLTGNQSYQQAYRSAQQGLDQIVSGLQQQNNDQKKSISGFYSDDVEGRIRSLQSQKRDTEHKLVSENDQVVSATMRTQPVSTETYNTLYIVIGVMALAAFGLMV